MAWRDLFSSYRGSHVLPKQELHSFFSLAGLGTPSLRLASLDWKLPYPKGPCTYLKSASTCYFIRICSLLSILYSIAKNTDFTLDLRPLQETSPKDHAKNRRILQTMVLGVPLKPESRILVFSRCFGHLSNDHGFPNYPPLYYPPP